MSKKKRKNRINGWIDRISIDTKAALSKIREAISELEAAENSLINKKECADGLVRSSLKSLKMAYQYTCEINEDLIQTQKDMWYEDKINKAIENVEQKFKV